MKGGEKRCNAFGMPHRYPHREITLKQATSEQVVVTGEAPVVDTKKTSTSSAFSQDYLKNVPTARDPWVILDQTPGVDVDRINVGGNQRGFNSANLRGIGTSSTLVLLNGRRMANFASPGDDTATCSPS